MFSFFFFFKELLIMFNFTLLLDLDYDVVKNAIETTKYRSIHIDTKTKQ